MTTEQEGLQVVPTTDKIVDDPGKIINLKQTPLYDEKTGAESIHHEITSQKRILGLKRRTLIGLAVLLLVVIIATIGGGVGGALGSRHSSSSSAIVYLVYLVFSSSLPASSTASSSASTMSSPASRTSTMSSTTTSSSSSISATPTSGRYNCPSDNGTTYSPSVASSLSFLRLCDVDFEGPGVNGRTNVMDLRYLIATSVEQCMDACAADRLAGSNCSAVSYGANITFALDRTDGINGNCFLKDQRSLVFEPRLSNVQAESAYLL